MASAETADLGPVQGSAPGEKGLADGSLGLISSVVMGMASTAPAYSLASALGFVVATCRAAVADHHAAGVRAHVHDRGRVQGAERGRARLRHHVHLGDPGVRRAWGWMGGWGIFAADVIVMANLAQIAGSYGYLLVGANTWPTRLWVTVAGIIWIVVMTWISWIGIEISATPAVPAAGHRGRDPGRAGGHRAGQGLHRQRRRRVDRDPASWFNPFNISSPGVLPPGILAAVFIYWGWDTRSPATRRRPTPPRRPGGPPSSRPSCCCDLRDVTLGAQAGPASAPPGIGLTNPANSGDVLSVLGTSIFGTGPAARPHQAAPVHGHDQLDGLDADDHPADRANDAARWRPSRPPPRSSPGSTRST